MYKLLSILSILVIISMLPAVLSAGTINPNQPDTGDTIPSWIKNTAGWWADDKIHDVVFVGAIRYLINEGIMVVMEPQVEEAKCNFKGK